MKETTLKNYMQYRSQLYEELLGINADHAMLSESNWIARGHYMCGEEAGIFVKAGDVVYMDFGQAYLNEMGYQHFALVLGICGKKALVVPMTSNEKTCKNAYDLTHLHGKKNLYCFPGIMDGLCKKTVLFLNDMKFINTARVIDIKGHIDIHEKEFQNIQKRIMNMIFEERVV